MDNHDLVRRQFGPTAKAYATSPSHSNPDALEALCVLAQVNSEDVALDIATGAGNTALALAKYAKSVVASDVTPEMLEETESRAKERGLNNLSVKLAAAENLPFPDESFSLVTCRVAPHHFADIRKAVREMARVLRPGGRLVIVDTCSPEDDDIDAQINAIELKRDPSHVRNYGPSEWRGFVAAAGLTLKHFETGFHDSGKRMDFDAWVKRINTPAADVAELRKTFENADPKLREAMMIEIDGGRIGFTLPQITLLATK